MRTTTTYAATTVSAAPTNSLLNLFCFKGKSPVPFSTSAFFYRRTGRTLFCENFLTACRETTQPACPHNLYGRGLAGSCCRRVSRILRNFGTQAARRQRSHFAAWQSFPDPHPARNRLPLLASMSRQRRAARRSAATSPGRDRGNHCRPFLNTPRMEAERWAEELAAGCTRKEECHHTLQFWRPPACARESRNILLFSAPEFWPERLLHREALGDRGRDKSIPQKRHSQSRLRIEPRPRLGLSTTPATPD